MSFEMMIHAWRVAEKFHKGQYYGEKPYMEHILDVDRNVVALCGIHAYNERTVARLHDVIEDTDCTLNRLKDLKFSDEVIKAVDAISKRKGETWLAYMSRVKANPLALVVKKCDTMANLKQSFIDQNSRRIVKYSNQLIKLEE